MAIESLRGRLLESVGLTLKPLGFRLQRSKARFARKRAEAGITDYYYLIVLSGEHGDRISPQVGVRHEAVERIFHLTSGFEPQYQADTPTLGSDIWRLLGEESYIIMASEDHLPDATAAVLAMFEQHALPYYERFSDLKVVNEVLNDDPGGPCPHRIMDYLLAATGVIVAKLIRHAGYARLAATYREQMRTFAGGFYLARYEALVASLENPETTTVGHG